VPASSTNLIIVQPNIDPYGKFNENNAAAQIQLLINLSEKQIDSSTRLIIWPETAMSVAELQNNIQNNLYYQPIFKFLNRHPSITLLSGIETYVNYQTFKATNTARKTPDGNYYDAFNASVYIKSNEALQFYNKGKLVPGVESLPSFLNFMGPVFEKFGGTAGGYGKSDSSSTFQLKDNPYVAAPIICYESIYGEYVASYVAKGANLLCIITNDGWWGNTPGHKQHLAYASLRAIETRRWVARSANTGISAVIDPTGKILETRDWDTPAIIKYDIPTSTEISFYVHYGDWLYKITSLLALLFIGWRGYSIIRMKISGGNK
jgi:apolipoprotein N-acyltransferase